MNIVICNSFLLSVFYISIALIIVLLIKFIENKRSHYQKNYELFTYIKKTSNVNLFDKNIYDNPNNERSFLEKIIDIDKQVNEKISLLYKKKKK